MLPDEDELIARLRDGDLNPHASIEEESPLRFAIRRLMPRLVDALLEAGADPDEREGIQQPPLHEAIEMFETGRHGWAGEAVPRIVEALIRAGADLDARGDNDFAALHAAALRGDERLCLQLIRAGADPSAVAEPGDPEAGWTPYEVAEFYGRVAVAAAIKTVVDPDELDRRRQEKAAALDRYRRSIPRSSG